MQHAWDVLRAFAQGVRNAMNGRGEADPSFDQEALAELRQEGISYCLELTAQTANDEERRNALFNLIREALIGLDVGFSQLFPDTELPMDENPEFIFESRPEFFWLLHIWGASTPEIPFNPFDIANSLLTVGREHLSTVEPDLPLPYDRTVFPFRAGTDCDDGDVPAEKNWCLTKMGIPEVWERTKGAGICIGHPDTGYAEHVKLTAPRRKDQAGYDFFDNQALPIDPLNYRQGVFTGNPGHGTGTASVIMGDGNGGADELTGVAPEASLIPIRTVKKVWWATSSNLAKAINYAATRNGDDKCHVISMSLGGRTFKGLKFAVDMAVARNIIVVAAAGNNLKYADLISPGNYSNSISVAATDHDDNPWKCTSRGSSVTVSAPGHKVWRAHRQTVNDPQPYDEVLPGSGSSYATAHTAGVAALWLAYYGLHTQPQPLGSVLRNAPFQYIFECVLKRTVRQTPGWDTANFGAGIVDAQALVAIDPEECARDLRPRYKRYHEDIRDLCRRTMSLLVHRIDQPDRVQDALLLQRLSIDDTDSFYTKHGPELLGILHGLLIEERHHIATPEDFHNSIQQAVRQNGSNAIREAMGQ